MKVHLTSILFLLIILSIPGLVIAESCDDPSLCTNKDPLACKNEQIDRCTEQLKNVQSQENTLKSQLKLIDGQTQVTTLKIEEASLQIEKLQREISDLDTRIERIGSTLDTLSEILLQRIVETYKYSNAASAIDLLFSSRGFSDLLERVKYIQVAQAYDKKKLYELQATKLAYNDQKQDKQTRQTQAEKLNKDLEVYKKQLADQKKAKDELLKVTQNNEANYQSLIKQLRADAASILQAISNVGIPLGEKNKGEVIAREGNTGCVYPPPPDGYHLHFEVYKDAKVQGGKIVDVATGESIQFQISSHLENPRPYLDSGKLQRPISGYSGDISQEFGYNKDYKLNGGFHTGLDMADPPGSPIYAADSGTAYAAGGGTCDEAMGYTKGTTLPAKGVIIDHHNGIVTLYWHIL